MLLENRFHTIFLELVFGLITIYISLNKTVDYSLLEWTKNVVNAKKNNKDAWSALLLDIFIGLQLSQTPNKKDYGFNTMFTIQWMSFHASWGQPQIRNSFIWHTP